GADSEDERVRDRARLEADDEGIPRRLAPERAQKVAGWHAQEQREQRQQQEGEGDRGGDDQNEIEGPPHGNPKPDFSSAARPAGLLTSATNFSAALRCFAPRTTAISYLTVGE